MKSENEPIRKILSKNIKERRNFLGYSQEKLAEKTGLSTQTINDIEGCRRWVSARTITKIARALNLEEYQLLLPEGNAVDSGSPIKSILNLKREIKKSIDRHFEDVIDFGIFK
jgi:transcriptional regulator with XRE-family HTH domain